ncbi:MAG: Transcriptional regulator, BadM/Rrf2 family [Candidatus Curtissbacteria bacterium GW2011_GWA1_40_16]|uniref:Transcriptional regulator, BadM/Rrf2 family n=1 Tax=Candidatus Curtissbacteria bacterium GW2011_GWA1_40_16 TaxID=1618405 RepID=A0A0G0REC6_9BACT|nr:MAG: Transcriptional regulator, BadM/Rrf2 family [Candidatus Curtissbacteria bacterium GW2011_GWA1_40_16]
MFKLSQKSDYGLILLSNVAKSKGVISVSSVAKKNKLSSKFLSQVANELKKAGIITSKEGVSGGYSLAKAANEIKILDVLVALDGGLVKGDCFEEDHECNCGAKDMWISMKQQMEETIGRKTVADLVVR